MEKVMALIVTFNRKEYLLNLLDSLKMQTRKLDRILIIDNCSPDQTAETLIEKNVINSYTELELTSNIWNDIEVLYYRNNQNTGGAGGFHVGTKLAMEIDNDYLWIMDDDVLPQPDCLEKLMSHISEEYGVCIPNRTTGVFRDRPAVTFNWKNYIYLASEKTYDEEYEKKEVVSVCDMPFEGPFLRYDILQKVGPSDEKYFIFYDDSDYAQRCLQYTNILFVTDAHLNKQILPQNNPCNFSWRDYYMARNDIIFDKKYNTKKWMPYIRATVRMAKGILSRIKHKNAGACKYIIKAYLDGICNVTGKTINPGSF